MEPVVWTTPGTTCGRCQAGLEIPVDLPMWSLVGQQDWKWDIFLSVSLSYSVEQWCRVFPQEHRGTFLLQAQLGDGSGSIQSQKVHWCNQKSLNCSSSTLLCLCDVFPTSELLHSLLANKLKHVVVVLVGFFSGIHLPQSLCLVVSLPHAVACGMIFVLWFPLSPISWHSRVAFFHDAKHCTDDQASQDPQPGSDKKQTNKKYYLRE